MSTYQTEVISMLPDVHVKTSTSITTQVIASLILSEVQAQKTRAVPSKNSAKTVLVCLAIIATAILLIAVDEKLVVTVIPSDVAKESSNVSAGVNSTTIEQQ